MEAPRPKTLCPQQYSSRPGETASCDNSFRKTALESLLSHYYFVPKLPTLYAWISARCEACAQNDASQEPRPNPGVHTVGTLPFEDLEVNFTEVKPYRGYMYLLVVLYA